LRTTFIVGFPGETEACFQRLLEFVRQTRFERLGVFTYSKEVGTRAARMQGQVPARVKRTRRDLLMATQRQIARQIAAASVGRTLQVLVERPAAPDELQVETADYMVARSAADAPEIDGRVYVRGRLPVGEFALVKVVGHTDYDLIAEPA